MNGCIVPLQLTLHQMLGKNTLLALGYQGAKFSWLVQMMISFPIVALEFTRALVKKYL